MVRFKTKFMSKVNVIKKQNELRNKPGINHEKEVIKSTASEKK